MLEGGGDVPAPPEEMGRRWAWRRRNGPYVPDGDSLDGRTH